jgi:hypothetical protein
MRFALALVVLASLAYAQQSIVQTAQATPTLSTLVTVLTTAAYAPVLNTLSGNGAHSIIFVCVFLFLLHPINLLSSLFPSINYVLSSIPCTHFPHFVSRTHAFTRCLPLYHTSAWLFFLTFLSRLRAS